MNEADTPIDRPLGELKELDLAWNPDVPDGDHYLEMHPHIGEGIMSTLAVACALDEGLDIVADDAPLHDCVIRYAEDELYSKLIKRRRADTPRTFSADRCKIELLVFQQFDLPKLTAKNILRLQNEGNELGRFHEEMAKVAQSIRDMREEARFEKRARNDWSQHLTFDANGKPLQDALADFFNGVLEQADFSKSVHPRFGEAVSLISPIRFQLSPLTFQRGCGRNCPLCP
jgi:hypothetical protein